MSRFRNTIFLFVASFLAGCSTMSIGECKEQCIGKGMILKSIVSTPTTFTRWAHDSCSCELPPKAEQSSASVPASWYSPFGELCPTYPDSSEGYNTCAKTHGGAGCRQREKRTIAFPVCK